MRQSNTHQAKTTRRLLVVAVAVIIIIIILTLHSPTINQSEQSKWTQIVLKAHTEDRGQSNDCHPFAVAHKALAAK